MTLKISDRKGYVGYYAEHSFNPSLKLDLNGLVDIEDFVRIYDVAMDKYSKCKTKYKIKEDIKKCMSDLKITGWQITVDDIENYLLFNLDTEQNYFFVEENMQFSPVQLRFALKS